MDRINRILGIIDGGLLEDAATRCLRCSASLQDEKVSGHFCTGCREFLSGDTGRDPLVLRDTHERLRSRGTQHHLEIHYWTSRRAWVVQPLGVLRHSLYSRQPYRQLLYLHSGLRHATVTEESDLQGYPASYAILGSRVFGLEPDSCAISDGTISYRYLELVA